MSLVNNPQNLVPSQSASLSTGKGTPTKLEGDFDGSNFCLYIALTEEAHARNLRFCKGAGKKVAAKGITYYSKFVGKLEPSPEKILENFMRLIRKWTAGTDMKHAIIFWNLNRGNRVNLHNEAHKIDAPKAQNKMLMFFDRNGKTTQSAELFLSLPLLHKEEVSTEKLNAYYKRLRHKSISEEDCQSIIGYFDFYYNTLRTTQRPEIVEVNTETPQELLEAQPEPIQQKKEVAQEPTRQPVQANFYEQTKPYQKQTQAKPTISQQAREEATKAIEEGKKIKEQKERFLRELANTQTSIAEKLRMYHSTYPTPRIDKEFLQEILTAYEN